MHNYNSPDPFMLPEIYQPPLPFMLIALVGL